MSRLSTCRLSPPRATTVEEVNAFMKAAAEVELKGIVGYTTAPLVSVDFNHTTESSNFDASLTKVTGNLVKCLAWYDNEWGFSTGCWIRRLRS